MARKGNINKFTKSFPFAPGIKWNLESGRYIIPKIDSNTWNRFISDRKLIVTAFGSFIESLFSLSVIEVLKANVKNDLYWIGNSEFENFHYLNGISSTCNILLINEDLQNYPLPLFCDAKSNVYFNVLNNVPVKRTFWGRLPQIRTDPIFKQIFMNSMLEWDVSYLPKMRRVGNDFINELIRQNKITERSKIITIILEKSDLDILGWTTQQVKEFIQIMSNKGYKIVLFTDDVGLYYGIRAITLNKDYRKTFQIIKKSVLVLSNDIQWLLAVLLLSKAGIVCKSIEGSMDLFKNAEYIGVENDIFSFSDKILPLDVAGICEGL